MSESPREVVRIRCRRATSTVAGIYYPLPATAIYELGTEGMTDFLRDLSPRWVVTQLRRALGDRTPFFGPPVMRVLVGCQPSTGERTLLGFGS
jgi:hypothetical protein